MATDLATLTVAALSSAAVVSCTSPAATGSAEAVGLGEAPIVASPDSLVPVVSPELALDAPVFLPGTSGDEHVPAIASNGSTYLVGMQKTTIGVSHDLVVTRVDANGTVLDPQGIEITPLPDQVDIGIASEGTDYLVVWTTSLGAKAARVDAGGVVLDPGGFDFPTGSGARPVYGAGYYFLPAGYHRLVRITATGTVVDDPPLQFTADTEPAGGYAPSLAVAGNTVLAVWAEFALSFQPVPINAMRFDGSGAPIDAAPFPVVTGVQAGAPLAATDGNGFLIFANGCSFGVGPSGPLQPPHCNVWGVSAASDGQQYFTTDGNVQAWRLASNGMVLEGPFSISSAQGTKSNARVANGPSGFAFAYENVDSICREVRVTRFDAAGDSPNTDGFVPLPNHIQVPNHQDSPRVAHNDSNHFVTWHDERTPAGTYGVRVSPTGQVLDASATFIASGAVEIASAGSDFIAVFPSSSAPGQLATTKITASGIVETPGGTTLDDGNPWTSHFNPRIAWDGSGYLVTYSTLYMYNMFADMLAAHLDVNGLLTSGPFYLSGCSGGCNSGRVTFDGTNYLVVWKDLYTEDLQGTLLPPNGPPGPTLPVAIDQPGNLTPEVASGGGIHLVVWERGADILGARLDATGSLLDYPPMVVCDDVGEQTHPSVDFDGTNFWVTWDDYRSGNQNIYATRIDVDGNRLDGNGFSVTTSPDAEQHAAVSALSGKALVVYEHNDTALQVPTMRVRARVLGAAGGTCGDDAECVSGFCVDGVCCDTSCGGGAADDCVACSTAMGGAVDGTCGQIADGTSCAAGVCDGGVCTGSSTSSSASSSSASASSSAASSASSSSGSASSTSASSSGSSSASSGSTSSGSASSGSASSGASSSASSSAGAGGLGEGTGGGNAADPPASCAATPAGRRFDSEASILGFLALMRLVRRATRPRS